MSGRASPFAELTGAEKQIKWLEVQSLRLPYMQGALENDCEGIAAEAMEQAQSGGASRLREAAEVHNGQNTGDKSEPRTPSKPQSAPPCAACESPAHTSGAERGDLQRTRHRQYDAVIARMRQAEMRAQGFKPIK